jgi:hypothetical protein
MNAQRPASLPAGRVTANDEPEPRTASVQVARFIFARRSSDDPF